MVDNNDEANINSTNMDLVEFKVQTKILLADSIHKTCHRCAVEDYTNSNKIDIITSLIINLGVKNVNYMGDSLFICCY